MENAAKCVPAAQPLKTTAGFYFRDGEHIRFAEISISEEDGATIDFRIDGVTAEVDPRRIYIAAT